MASIGKLSLLGVGVLLASTPAAPGQFMPAPCANCNKNFVPPNARFRPLPQGQPAASFQNNFPAVGPGSGFGGVVSTNQPRQGIASVAAQVTGSGTGGPPLAPQTQPGTMFNQGYVNPYAPGSPFGGYGGYGGYGSPYGGFPGGGYPGGGYPFAVGTTPYNGFGSITNPTLNPYYVNPFNGLTFPSPFYSPFAGYQGFGPPAAPGFAPMGFGNQGLGNPFPAPLPN